MAGQIIKRGDRKYLVRVYLGEVAGKRKYLNKTINGNKGDAQAYLNKVLRERDTESFVEPSKQILKEYLDTWAESTLKARVTEKTYNDYKDRLNWYVKPALGDLKLQQIGPEAIQELYNNMLDRGLSPRSVRYTHAVLKNALQQAVKWGKLYRNPCDLVDLPKQKKDEMKILNPDQVAEFMEAVTLSPWKAFFSLLITSGMRPGEALALRWSSVDFSKNRVTVNRSLVRKRGGGYELQEPKTSRSRRTIPLPSSTIEDLKELKEGQKVVKLEGFIFSDKTGEPVHDRTMYKEFKRIIKDAKLPDLRLYDLRHTCATLLLAAGENPKIVSERLGHANITLTLDTYSHVLPDMQEAAAEKLEGLLFNGK